MAQIVACATVVSSNQCHIHMTSDTKITLPEVLNGDLDILSCIDFFEVSRDPALRLDFALQRLNVEVKDFFGLSHLTPDFPSGTVQNIESTLRRIHMQYISAKTTPISPSGTVQNIKSILRRIRMQCFRAKITPNSLMERCKT